MTNAKKVFAKALAAQVVTPGNEMLTLHSRRYATIKKVVNPKKDIVYLG